LASHKKSIPTPENVSNIQFQSRTPLEGIKALLDKEQCTQLAQLNRNRLRELSPTCAAVTSSSVATNTGRYGLWSYLFD
jgi:hypothetical protein